MLFLNRNPRANRGQVDELMALCDDLEKRQTKKAEIMQNFQASKILNVIEKSEDFLPEDKDLGKIFLTISQG